MGISGGVEHTKGMVLSKVVNEGGPAGGPGRRQKEMVVMTSKRYRKMNEWLFVVEEENPSSSRERVSGVFEESRQSRGGAVRRRGTEERLVAGGREEGVVGNTRWWTANPNEL